MGWKSSISITREDAIIAIIRTYAEDKTVSDFGFTHLDSDQLLDLMDELNIGDDDRYPYYGYNFMIVEHGNQD